METKIKDPRIYEYRYWSQLIDHLDGDVEKLFSGDFLWPKQAEWHLPSDHIRPCKLSCSYCAATLYDKELYPWEMEGLELLDKLQGAIPFHIFGGNYTDPVHNAYFMTFLATVKKHNNSFGIHTSGVNLLQLDESQAWLSELNRIATDKTDYISISLDAGLAKSWCAVKGVTKTKYFDDIILALRKAVKIREARGGGHSIRVCYLISPGADSVENFEAIVDIAKEIGIDSVRFSIPFAFYNQPFENVRKYKANREIPGDKLYQERLAPYLSESENERPYIFYVSPWFTDIDRFTFERCFYWAFQITMAADGFVYKCSTTAAPTAKHCRLGKITADLNEFKKMIVKNQKDDWNCKTQCFEKGLRCNRMSMEICTIANKLMKDKKIQ